MKVHIDSLVRGIAGYSGKVVEGRVYRIDRNGWVALVDRDENQWVIYDPEVIDKPRPLSTRTDIPSRLR